MRSIVAGRYWVNVIAWAATHEDEVRMEALLTSFLTPMGGPAGEDFVRGLSNGFVIHVLDRARPAPPNRLLDELAQRRKTSPHVLAIRDGGTEFWCDTAERVGVAIYEDTEKLDGRQIAKPFRWLFSVLLDALRAGVMLPHAAALALGFSRKALLLVGPSGSGKSSITGTWLREEHPVIADDRVPVWKNDSEKFVVGPLYTSFCLDEEMVTRLRLGGDAEEEPRRTELRQNGKVVFALPPRGRLYPEIAAIVRARVDRSEGIALRGLPKGDALVALTPSSLITSIGVSKDVMAGLTELVEQTPCYELVVGSMLEMSPNLLARLLRGDP